MFEEKAQSYRVKDKEIYRVKLACQNTKVYRVNTQLTKGTITLLYFFCFFLHMRTLSVLDKYRANVLGPCRARAITLFTVFPWRVTFKDLASKPDSVIIDSQIAKVLSVHAENDGTAFKPSLQFDTTQKNVNLVYQRS